jgi:threonine/homoserine/homoserine lactone efflux protein
MFPVNYFLYLQIIIFLFITPGTPRIVIVSHSVNYGVKKCLWTALGDISANTIQMILVVFVIGSFFSNNPQILNVFKWIGVVYLFYLAYDTYKSNK